MSIRPYPTFFMETTLRSRGIDWIAGVDEAGCGALAGPVVAAAVVLDPDCIPDGLRDSKLLSAKKRDHLYGVIDRYARAWTVGIADVQDIAKINVREATFLAMRRALQALPSVEHVLVDGWRISGWDGAQDVIIKGDQTVASISAASIMAKVTRDRMLQHIDTTFPEYGFAAHKGYATAAHKRAIAAHGPCAHHRTSYSMFTGAQ